MSGGSRPSIAVWDIVVRLGHWSLVTGIAVTWLTIEGPAVLHDGFGYAVLAILALRLVWGFAGSRYARFAGFIRSPRATLGYARAVADRREPRYLGHNPLGGWMIVALIVSALGAGISGWLYTTDRFWGVEWVERVHAGFAWAVLGLAALHVAGVVFTSLRQRENLVAAMLHGRKRAPTADEPAPDA